MTESNQTHAGPEYTRQAASAVIRAARAEHDFAGWLAQVLAAAAGQLGSSDALTEGRPGSWEAALVRQLVKGTVGYDDGCLPAPAGHRKLTDARARDIRWRYDDGPEVTQRQVAAEFGVSPSTVSDIVNGRTWGWLA
jgi:Helix-turn-helix